MRRFFSGNDHSGGDYFTVTNAEQHAAAFKKGAELISPYMTIHDQRRADPSQARSVIQTGMAYLDGVLAYNPENWAALWIKGKAYQTLGNQPSANSCFRRAFELQKENPDVAREYGISCTDLGLGKEAVEAASHAVSLRPDEAGLRANLALAFLIDGQNEAAKTTIAIALEMDPADTISRTVEEAIDDVIAGRRRQPRSVADLQYPRW